jgi:hypothetical protein
MALDALFKGWMKYLLSSINTIRRTCGYKKIAFNKEPKSERIFIEKIVASN